MGKSAPEEHIIMTKEQLDDHGIRVFHVGRGGDVTYHGPGQLVGYPILDLKPDRKDLHRYLRDLEEVLIRSLSALSVRARRRDNLTGVWIEDRKIAGMAESNYAKIAPHLYCGPIEGAANIQLSACSPNFLILEGIQRWEGFHAEILKKPILWDSGYVIPPTEPGLGVELNEEVALANPYNDSALHLEMADAPIL